MRKVSISKCKAGDILWDDVFSDNGIILVAKNTVINDYIKTKLMEFGIYDIKIYDVEESSSKLADFAKKYKDCLLLIKDLLRGVVSGQFEEVEKVAYYISDMIYKHISESNFITQGLQRIRHNDEYTYTHCINTAFYSMLIGHWINLPEKDLYNLIIASLLHDIGKTKVPPEILNKKGRLDPEEFEIMKQHAALGYEIIKDLPEFDNEVKKAILLHHERVDGSGYPFGLKGDAISLFAKIISISDVYDAMTQNRIYKKKVSPFESFKMFLTEGVSQFDYRILYEFLRHLAPLYIGTNVELSTGEIGEVVYIPPQDITYPILSINSKYVDLSRNTSVKVLQVV